MEVQAITFDLFLLIIALVLIGIVLFISLVSVIYTVRLAYKIDTLLKVLDSFRPVPKMEYPVPAEEPTTQKRRSDTTAGEAVPIPVKRGSIQFEMPRISRQGCADSARSMVSKP